MICLDGWMAGCVLVALVSSNIIVIVSRIHAYILPATLGGEFGLSILGGLRDNTREWMEKNSYGVYFINVTNYYFILYHIIPGLNKIKIFYKSSSSGYGVIPGTRGISFYLFIYLSIYLFIYTLFYLNSF